MTQYTRRQFLKTIGALAAAAGLPVNLDALAESDEALPIQATEAAAPAESIPATPQDTTAGYIKINGVAMPILSMGATMTRGEIESAGYGDFARSYFPTRPTWELDVMARGALPEGVIGERVDFELVASGKYANSFQGQGWVTQYTQDFHAGPEKPLVAIAKFTITNSGYESLAIMGPDGTVIKFPLPEPPEVTYSPPTSDDDYEYEDYYGDYWDDED